MIKQFIIAIRPRQWIKNGFVVAPLFFSGRLYSWADYPATFLAFASFCLASSSIYLLNDIIDLEADRWHPLKKSRPIAAGRLSRGAALIGSAVLGVVSVGLGMGVNWQTCVTVCAYLVLSGAYCLWLKHVLLVDVLVIALGFVLRGIAGAACIDVPISASLASCTFFLALFLALCKRYHEFDTLGVDAELHRIVFDSYTRTLLQVSVTAAAAGTLASYAIYTLGALSPASPGKPWMIATTLFVAAGLGRYAQLTVSTRTMGKPTEVLMTDKVLMVVVAGWLGALYWIFSLD